jgi:hypothetical protein
MINFFIKIVIFVFIFSTIVPLNIHILKAMKAELVPLNENMLHSASHISLFYTLERAAKNRSGCDNVIKKDENGTIVLHAANFQKLIFNTILEKKFNQFLSEKKYTSIENIFEKIKKTDTQSLEENTKFFQIKMNDQITFIQHILIPALNSLSPPTPFYKSKLCFSVASGCAFSLYFFVLYYTITSNSVPFTIPLPVDLLLPINVPYGP